MNKKRNMFMKSGLLAFALIGSDILLISTLLGLLISREVVPMDTGIASGAVLVDLAVFLVCFVIIRKNGKNRLLTAIVISTIICVLRTVIGIIFFSDAEWWLQGAGITLMAGAAAGLLSGMKKNRRR